MNRRQQLAAATGVYVCVLAIIAVGAALALEWWTA